VLRVLLASKAQQVHKVMLVLREQLVLKDSRAYKVL
jgi:hypothetical protein